MARSSRKKRSTRNVSVTFEGLEVARGHDGLLRGEPEPVVVLCAFLVDEQRAECVLRHVERFVLDAPPPTLARPGTAEKPKLSYRASGEGWPWLLVLAAAIEEDAGKGAQEIFARLPRADTLSLFTVDDAVPEPRAAHLATPSLAHDGGPHGVHLLFGGQEPGAFLRGDDWIGAAAWATTRDGKDRTLRLPLRADDGKNDWTLVVRVRA